MRIDLRFIMQNTSERVEGFDDQKNLALFTFPILKVISQTGIYILLEILLNAGFMNVKREHHRNGLARYLSICIWRQASAAWHWPEKGCGGQVII